uniref:Uncharacterized protein n=1 Tax=Anguilla anguilla TaxID=7936 RepID=A0A0E9T1W9_ANGAN
MVKYKYATTYNDRNITKNVQT